ncbi:MAG: radical SAM protein [Pyrinomonadaceae bacterium]|nr:radical SAM protein [Pyrinomonadaceae bacterium]MCX7639678.1 radical SAM protein [Pyrinomonadaceae bacterium]MDW8304580.1 radical SAM protein [Acidobacteriota bacterium]
MPKSNGLSRFIRGVKHTVRAFISTKHPVLVHIVPIRRCNLSCAYCNEYDKTSSPVPIEEMIRRIDRLAALGTSVVTISGGEPMLHPQIYEIIARIRYHGMIAGLISNGYYFQPEKILKLNDAGLDYLQISIDNVNPDEVSKKSLKVLDKKLVNLKKYAKFKVNINSVIGSGVRNPEDALVIAKRARELGFSSTVGVIHDGMGLLKPLSEREKEVYRQIKALGARSYARWNWFQDYLVEGKEYKWRCRAGARYLYICEDGLVHWCSQQRGTPGISLYEYTLEDMRREYFTEKWCAPTCTIQCVHQVAHLDAWRDPQVPPDEYKKRRIKRETIARILSVD